MQGNAFYSFMTLLSIYFFVLFPVPNFSYHDLIPFQFHAKSVNLTRTLAHDHPSPLSTKPQRPKPKSP
jgi:hypothetical protein